MTKKLRKMLVCVLIAAALLLCLFISDKAGVFENARYPLPWLGTALHLLLAVSAYLIAGYDVLLGAARNIAKGHVFDEKFLMMIATFAAFGIGEYTEAVAVMVFYQVGEWFQGFAVGRSRRSISELMKIAPEYANVEVDGVLTECDPEQVAVGDRFVVKPGERVPLDGIVEEGDSMLDIASLTGESVPRRVRTGDEVLSGCVNLEGVLKVRATKVYEDSTVAKILELVENASQKKAPVEQFITRFAKYYTPVVTAGAVLLALIPPIFLGNWAEWIRRACTFLVISCPCALVISVPLGFFGGIGASSRIGVLVKGSTHLEMLSKIRTMAFDKTGTLTKGEFKVAKVLGADGEVLPEAEKAEMLRLLSRVETYSTHPIASAIREAAEAYRAPEAESTAKELAGRGIEALIDGKTYFAGNRKLLSEHGIEPPAIESAGTIVYLFSERTLLATVLIEDGLKDGVKEGLRTVRASGVAKLVMLTGDRVKTAERIAEELGIDEVHAELLPGDKVETLEKLMADGKNGKVAFIGDGINDAPVLMRADLGIAMGAIGSDAAIEAADVVLMDDDVRKLGRTVKISRKTLRIVYGNIIFALFVKLAALVLGAFGVATIWMAMFADVGVAFICILNAMRALRIPGGK